MRIGTWNLAGRLDQRHRRLLESQDCDVWLLTEARPETALAGLQALSWSTGGGPDKRWAAVFSRHAGEPSPSPHAASAAARTNDGWTWCSSVLPWRGSGDAEPWPGVDHAARTRGVLEALAPALVGRRLVWGGDWNHALSGPEQAGSAAGRACLLDLLHRLGLHAPTAPLAHARPGLLSIDHIAVPVPVTSVRAVAAEVDGRRLSDHDAYVLDVVLPSSDFR